MPSHVFRFAPSPNGPLHLGHALSALTGFRLARRHGGRFLVRIEDIDTARTREEHVASILADLAWLGITWEQPVLRQSRRFAAYAEAARCLDAMGLIYPCFATRSDIAAAAASSGLGNDPDGAPLYPGIDRSLPRREAEARIAAGEAAAWRLDMARALEAVASFPAALPLSFSESAPDGTARPIAADPSRWGDAVILRKDTPASYHLAVVVDDAAQGVTWVTRGADLFAATDLHRLLQTLLGLPEPFYSHHPLIFDATGAKLSKSAGAPSLSELRAAGWTPTDVFSAIGIRD
ncbi:MAG: tRNA glutamyl-Q(34) synthetase GluQRS [Hyphomicrobiaceae bacterium]|nr:tRNA glutamyl-Q(34) synthetase GluQRS [Hyphomicrobiaceae bacterium]